MKFSFIIYLGLLFITSSCTNKTSGTQVSLDLSSYNVAQQKIGVLSCTAADCKNQYVLNVTGPGIQPIYKKLECLQSAPNCSLDIEVLSGENRLFQLLSLQDQTNGAQLINYGDTLTSISGSKVDVTITMQNIGTTGKSFAWAGQYIRSDGSKPTGQIDIFAKPVGDKPAMLIESKEIIDGWFKLLMIEASGSFSGFRYKLGDEILFPEFDNAASPGVNLAELKSYVASNNTKASSVEYTGSSNNLYRDTDPTGAYSWAPIQSDEYNFIFGFFGAGVNSNFEVPKEIGTAPFLCGTDAASSACLFNVVGGASFSIQGSTHSSTLTAGVTHSIQLNQDKIGMGIEQALGISGAFKTISGSFIYCAVSIRTTCAWTFTSPDVDLLISSVDVFRGSKPADIKTLYASGEENINCEGLSSGRISGFSKIPTMNAQPKTGVEISSLGSDMLIVCLKKSDGSYFKSTAQL